MGTRREFIHQATAVATIGSVPFAAFGESVGPTTKAKAHLPRGSAGARIIRREETVLRYPVSGDNWHMSWAADGVQYVSLCDGYAEEREPKGMYNSRMLALRGGPREASFELLPHYPDLWLSLDKSKYYNFGTIALDGYLYQFLSTHNAPIENQATLKPGELRFVGAKLIYSPDNGRTWHNQDGSTPVVWETWGTRSGENMVFFEEHQEAFSLLSVLQMGRNYEYNRDGYIYVYAPNGNTEGTMNELVMFRVPKRHLLTRSKYQYFAGLQRNGDARWIPDITARRAVHVFPQGWVNTHVHPFAWHPSVVYNAPLDVYLMANWGMGAAPDGMWFGKPSYLGFWVARQPWGPWTQIHEETAWLPADDRNARAYEPQIAPKWIAADGKSFWLVWTDYQIKDREAYSRFFNEEISEKLKRNQMTDRDWIRRAAKMREHMPYYAFNLQKVDLVLP